ncbi:MAG: tetraacyldisaccharide 4'-kinase [Candidatus Krumholzibacteriia bacterium]
MSFEIMDLRPRSQILAGRLWSRSAARERAPGEAGWWDRAVAAWTLGRVRRRRLPAGGPFLVSLGNLSLGGTGKTPVLLRLAADLAGAGLAVGILTRGYGSALPGPLVVSAGNEGCGDEARLMASRLAGTGTVVVQARRRSAGLEFLRRQAPDLDLVLLEDAHQTGGIGRDLDVLLLDRWRVEESPGRTGHLIPLCGPVLPFGPWREPADGARRAGIWLVEAERAAAGVGRWGGPVAAFARRPVLGVGTIPGRAVKDGPWAALSGIARPEPFEAAATAAVGSEPALVIRCRDHEPFGPGVRGRILAAVRRCGASSVVCTAKDWIKLEGVWPGDLNGVVLDQRLVWTSEPALPDLIRKRRSSSRR